MRPMKTATAPIFVNVTVIEPPSTDDAIRFWLRVAWGAMKVAAIIGFGCYFWSRVSDVAAWLWRWL